jgi:hypothetical protein
MLQDEVFIFEFTSVDGFSTSSISFGEISSLAHVQVLRNIKMQVEVDMKPGMTLWKVEPLKWSGLRDVLDIPLSPFGKWSIRRYSTGAESSKVFCSLGN